MEKLSAEKIDQRKTVKITREQKLQAAIGMSLTEGWQKHREFCSSIRRLVGEDLEWTDIGDALCKWIEKRTVYSEESKKGEKRRVLFSPVEWLNAHTESAMLRLKRA